MRPGQILSANTPACQLAGARLVSPFAIASHPSLMLRGGAGGGVDLPLIFVMRVYNQGVQEQ